MIVHAVEYCQHCQRDLREVESLQVERRQVLDLPPTRVVVIEHQAQQQLLPYERGFDLLGPSKSVGTLQGLVERRAEQLEPVEQQIKAALSRADVLHQDETGLYVAGHRHWMLSHSELSIDAAQTRHGCALGPGTSVGRPSRFTCSLAHLNS